MAVTEGTLKDRFEGSTIAAAGKTGTAEYCDEYVAEKNLCTPVNGLPMHGLSGMPLTKTQKSQWLLLSIMVVKAPAWLARSFGETLESYFAIKPAI